MFIVQNVNGCSSSLNGLDRDQSVNPGSANFVPPVIAGGSAFNLNPALNTGACSSGDVGWGVKSTGIELEASFNPVRDIHSNLGFTWADTRYRDNLVGSDTGAPLNPALRVLPGNRVSNAPEYVATGAVAWTPPLGSSGITGLVYVDARWSSHYNTGSDLFPQKLQDSYTIVNGRIGVHGPDDAWSIELWAQNLLNKDYAQVAFNSPFQAGGSTTPPFAAGFTFAPFIDPAYPGGRQLFSAIPWRAADVRRDLAGPVRRARAGSSAGTASAASARDPDLPGRIGDPGEQRLPGAAAPTATATSAPPPPAPAPERG